MIGVPTHVLRFWETKFSHIRPMKKGGGRRYYRPEDIAILHGIKVFLYDRDYSIKELQEFLRTQGADTLIEAGQVSVPDEVPTPEVSAAVSELEPESTMDTESAAEAGSEVDAESPATASDVNADAEGGAATLLDALSRLQTAREKLNQSLKKG